jgi:hypothetical protein
VSTWWPSHRSSSDIMAPTSTSSSTTRIRRGGPIGPGSDADGTSTGSSERQVDVKDGALAGHALDDDPAAVTLDDAHADRQAQAGALSHRLRGEEWLEQPGLDLERDTGAGVSTSNQIVSRGPAPVRIFSFRAVWMVRMAWCAFVTRLTITCCS